MSMNQESRAEDAFCVEERVTPLRTSLSRRRFTASVGAALLGVATSPLIAACGGGNATNSTDRDDMAEGEESSASSSTEATQPASDSSDEQSGPVIIAVFGGGLSKDPTRTTTVEDWAKIQNTFNGLVRYKPGTFELEPDLAEKWEIDSTGTEYTFTLKRGIKFHRGFGEVTAEDVKFSIERQLDPQLASLVASNLEDVDHVEIVDTYTAKIVLSAPSAPFLSKIVLGRGMAGGIVSKRAAEELGNETYDQHPIGTGPFAFDSEIPNQVVKYIRYDDYHEGPAKPSGLEIRTMPDETTRGLAIEKGEVHLTAVSGSDVIETYQDGQRVQFFVSDQMQLMGLFLNYTIPPLDSPEVRRALAHAINLQEVIDGAKLGYAIPASPGCLHPAMFGFDESLEPIPYDPEFAKRELDRLGISGLELNLVGTSGSNTATIAAILQQQFAQVGVTFNIQQLERGALSARRAAPDSQGTLVSFGRNPEPDSILSIFTSSQIPPGGNNYARYTGIDDLMQQQRAETDEAKRAEILKQIQQRLAADLPMIPIWWDQVVVLATPGLQGYVPDAMGGFWVHNIVVPT